MPKVEAYGPRQIADQPAPAVRQDFIPGPETFGAGLGATISNVAELGTRIYAEEKDKQDQLALLEADNKIAGWVQNRLYDPQQGALTVKGKDALALPDTVGQEYSDLVGTIGQGLTPRQRVAFRNRALARGQDLSLQLHRHAFDEMQSYDNQETEAGISNAISAAAANPTDMRNVRDSLDTLNAIVTDHAKRQGFGPDETQYAHEQTTTKLHTAVVDSLLAKDQDRAAQVYYEETKDQISGEAQVRIEKALEEGSLRGESQRQSDAILSKTSTETDAIEQAKAIQDPKLRDEVQQRVVQAWGLKKQAQRDDTEQRMIDAGNLIDGNPAKGVRAIPPASWTSFTPSEKASLEAYAKRNAPGGEAAVKTDWAAYDVLERLASSSDPTNQQQFADLVLPMYKARLSDGDFRHFEELQGAVRKKGPDALKTLTVSDAMQRRVEDGALLSIGMNPNPVAPGKNGYDATATQNVLGFRRAMRDAVAAQEQASGNKKLTEPDVQAIADSLVIQTAAGKTHWFTANEPTRYEFNGAAPVTKASQIPASARQLLEQAARSRNRPVTDDALVQWFNAYLQTLRPGGGR